MFGNSQFEKLLTALAKKAGLKVADVTPRGARMVFETGGRIQILFVIPYGDVWEFSCPSVIGASDAGSFPKEILVEVLRDNARGKRGFWCIERIEGKEVIEYMYNIRADLLTPDEFKTICWAVVKKVDEFERSHGKGI